MTMDRPETIELVGQAASASRKRTRAASATLVRCAVCLGAQALDVDGAGREVTCWGCNGEGVVEDEQPECKGHPADAHDAMGSTVYCDGS